MTEKEHNGILLYAQITPDKYIHTVFYELLDKSKELAQKLGNVPVNAVIFTTPEQLKEYKESFENMGVNKVYYFEDEKFNQYSSEIYSSHIVRLARKIKPEIILIGATCQGRDLAPRISSALKTGLTADCIDLDINEKFQLAATRPTYGGELLATILCKTYPQMATVRPNVFKVREIGEKYNTEFIRMPVDDGIKNNVEIIDFNPAIHSLINELDSAQIIVAGGMGLKNSQGFELIKALAEKIGGTIAASRAAVEAGLASSSIQVGQTGKTVHPRLYIACGISGAIQHTVGMDKSEYIIAINNDPDAQIFEIADMGIVGDVFEIIPELIKKL